MSIHILDKELTQKIAAGEVVERPSSVVKELIENAIDAGAKSISIEIEDGGTTYIRVTDNGVGMNEEDAELCFSTHATSKINSEEDLFNIATLGFRGEAIPSISSVSKLTLYTRERDSECAIKIVNHGGNIISKEQCGRPEGTTIIVEDLFYNIPARLKFLKKPSTEAAQISSIVQKYILARPDISFRFISNGKDVYHSNGDNSLKNAIHVIYGNDIYMNLIPINFECGNVRIDGFIGNPSIARATKAMQSLFVNGRYIRSDIISNSIKQGYLNRIMPAKHPFFALNLHIPYSDIDVNVHPNKLDVRFHEEGFVQECFFKAVKEAFDNLALPHASAMKSIAMDKPNKQIDMSEFVDIDKRNTNEIKKSLIDIVNSTVEAPVTLEKKPTVLSQSNSILDKNDYVSNNFDYAPPKRIEVKNNNSSLPEETEQNNVQESFFSNIISYNLIGQVFNTYIIVEYEDKLILIDQHAAHERINTDKLMKQLEQSNIPKQTLLIPIILQLALDDFILVMESKEQFGELGFDIEEFGNNTIRINTVPHLFGEADLKDFFFETMDSIKNNPKIETRKHTIFQHACKHSIKAGQRLTDDEIKELIKITIEGKSPLNCPHGRPIVVVKQKKEIEKWFMRIV